MINCDKYSNKVAHNSFKLSTIYKILRSISVLKILIIYSKKKLIGIKRYQRKYQKIRMCPSKADDLLDHVTLCQRKFRAAIIIIIYNYV